MYNFKLDLLAKSGYFCYNELDKDINIGDYMQRYFVNKEAIQEPYIYITGDDCHHIGMVMRMKPGDKVFISDEERSFIAVIEDIRKEQVTLLISEELHEEKELPFNVTIAHGLVRREKMEEVIDYITELGAYSYIPVVMSRSIVKVNFEQLEKKSTRYAKIAKEAAEQSHRLKIMEVKAVETWKNFLKISKDFDLCLYAYEASPKDDSLKQILKTKKYSNILVLVGPEGGISEKEVDDLKKNGFLPISLGPRILRTQVAPLYIMSALSYEWEAKE